MGNVPIGTLVGMNWLMAVAAPVDSAPAAGAEIKQIVIGTIAISIWMTFMLILGMRHRSGSTTLLDSVDAATQKRFGIPGWALLPYAVATLALAIGGVGFVWDVALHLDSGRDAGPFANPSHYMLIVAVVGFVTAGWLAIVMPKGHAAGDAAVRIGHEWYAPAGGVAMLACGTLSMMGFVADDVWHRLFGQDVTLWGPTHLMMITGGLLVLFCAFVLLREGMRTERQPRTREEKRAAAAEGERKSLPMLIANALLLGGMLVGFTIAYQQEFSYGFPQFRLLFHPLLIAFSSAIVLTAARTMLGRGGALLAALGALAIHGILSLIVTYVFGELTLHFPLYLAGALCVELAALLVLSRGRYAFAGLSALLIATLGTLAEFGWSHTWMPVSWPDHLLLPAIGVSVIGAGCGAVLGTFFGTTVTARADSSLLGRKVIWTPIAAIATFAILCAVMVPQTAPQGATASVKLTEVTPSPGRTVHAQVTYPDKTFGEGADWFQSFAWQGGGHAFTAPMTRVAPGVWKTSQPIPVDGTWKTGIRMHKGNTMAAVTVYMPADTALKLAEVPASASFTRPLQMDRILLQRERLDNLPEWLFTAGSWLVAGMTILLILLLGWALLRVARGGPLAAERTSESRSDERAISGTA